MQTTWLGIVSGKDLRNGWQDHDQPEPHAAGIAATQWAVFRSGRPDVVDKRAKQVTRTNSGWIGIRFA